MSQRIDQADLIARALGRLDGPERERVDIAVAADPALGAELDRIAQHLLLYDALPDAPDAPAFERLSARLDAEPQGTRVHTADLPRTAPARTPRRFVWATAAAAAVLFVAFVASAWLGREDPGRGGVVEARLGSGIEVLRDGRVFMRVAVGAERALELEPGDVLRADRPAEVTLAERVHVVLDGGAPLTVEDSEHVALRSGRARFDVQPGTFVVDTPSGAVEVVGTKFEVDLRYTAPAVRVMEGEVRFGGQMIVAGYELSADGLVALTPRSSEWLEPRLDLSVRGDDRVRQGAPLELQVGFVNDGYAEVRTAAPGGLLTALRIEIWRIDATGAPGDGAFTLSVHEGDVLYGANLLEPGQAVILGARERRTLSVRLLVPFPTPGRYGLRAWYDGADEGPRIPSNPLEVEVSE